MLARLPTLSHVTPCRTSHASPLFKASSPKRVPLFPASCAPRSYESVASGATRMSKRSGGGGGGRGGGASDASDLRNSDLQRLMDETYSTYRRGEGAGAVAGAQ